MTCKGCHRRDAVAGTDWCATCAKYTVKDWHAARTKWHRRPEDLTDRDFEILESFAEDVARARKDRYAAANRSRQTPEEQAQREIDAAAAPTPVESASSAPSRRYPTPEEFAKLSWQDIWHQFPEIKAPMGLVLGLQEFCNGMNEKNIERNARLDAIDKRLDEIEQRTGSSANAERVADLTTRVTQLEQRASARGLVYRGIWTEGESYVAGDFVTHAGSLWACLQPTKLARPGAALTQGGKTWQLAAKRGADGKSAEAK